MGKTRARGRPRTDQAIVERAELDPLDISWPELATPEGAPSPNEKRRERGYAAEFLTPERLRRLIEQ